MISSVIKLRIIFFDLFVDLNASMVRYDVFKFFKIVISVNHLPGI